MTTVGHVLMGTAIGVLCLPLQKSTPWKAAYFAAFALLPNIPDLPFPGWGHDRYDLSHSLFVNLILGLAAAFLLWRQKVIPPGGKILLAGAAAWLSHLLLDALYGDGPGVAIFRPFSDAYLHLPIPWFAVVWTAPQLTTELFREFAMEFASYVPLVVLAAGLRRIRLARRVSQERAEIAGDQSARRRRDSNRQTPLATETFRLATLPRMGMRASISQRSRVRRRMPSPSEPSTQAIAAGSSDS